MASTPRHYKSAKQAQLFYAPTELHADLFSDLFSGLPIPAVETCSRGLVAARRGFARDKQGSGAGRLLAKTIQDRNHHAVCSKNAQNNSHEDSR